MMLYHGSRRPAMDSTNNSTSGSHSTKATATTQSMSSPSSSPGRRSYEYVITTTTTTNSNNSSSTNLKQQQQQLTMITHPSFSSNLQQEQQSSDRKRDKEQEQNDLMMMRILSRQDSITTMATKEFSPLSVCTPAFDLGVLKGSNKNNNVMPNETTSSRSHRSSSQRSIMRHDLVRAVIHDFYDDLNSNIESKSREIWNALYERYHAPTYTMIRPTGNPLPTEGFIDMFVSKDVKLINFRLVGVESIQILAEDTVAVATYTVDQHFKYKGTLNEDRAVLTCVLEMRNGEIKICHEQRTKGVPIPDDEEEEDRHCDDHDIDDFDNDDYSFQAPRKREKTRWSSN